MSVADSRQGAGPTKFCETCSTPRGRVPTQGEVEAGAALLLASGELAHWNPPSAKLLVRAIFGTLYDFAPDKGNAYTGL